MTFDVHHPSLADVDPLGEGLSARRCRQRASERDKSQRFHDDVFHCRSPFAFNLPARCPATTKNHTRSFSIGQCDGNHRQCNLGHQQPILFAKNQRLQINSAYTSLD
jgi:hypothetical protein